MAEVKDVKETCKKNSFPLEGISVINFLSENFVLSSKNDKNSNDDKEYKGAEIPFAIPNANETPTLILVKFPGPLVTIKFSILLISNWDFSKDLFTTLTIDSDCFWSKELFEI